MADVEHPRPSYQHHAGFYRKIMPGDDLKPWEWSPVTDHSLPMSPMRPVFQMSKAYPPGLEPSSTFMVVKAPANGAKKKGLWAAIRRFLRFGRFCCLYRSIWPLSIISCIASPSQTPTNEVAVTRPLSVQQGRALDTGGVSVSKVQPCEWKQYGYWARPYLNNVECPNSRESLLSLDWYSTNTDQPSTAREASLLTLSKIWFSPWEVPTHTINTQNYGFQAPSIVLSHHVLLVGQSPFLVNPCHFPGKFNSTPCCSTWSGDLRHYHGTSESILTITFLTVVPDFTSHALRLIELNQPLGLSSRICILMLWLGTLLRSFPGPLLSVIPVASSVETFCWGYIRNFINLWREMKEWVGRLWGKKLRKTPSNFVVVCRNLKFKMRCVDMIRWVAWCGLEVLSLRLMAKDGWFALAHIKLISSVILALYSISWRCHCWLLIPTHMLFSFCLLLLVMHSSTAIIHVPDTRASPRRLINHLFWDMEECDHPIYGL